MSDSTIAVDPVSPVTEPPPSQPQPQPSPQPAADPPPTAVSGGAGPATLSPEAIRNSANLQQAQNPNPSADIDPQRRSQIDTWVDKNASAHDSFLFVPVDAAGGERAARALRGESSLGALNDDERTYLAQAVTQHWQTTGNVENIREAADGVRDHPQARAALAQAYTSTVADYERHLAEGGEWLTTREAGQARYEMLNQAIDLDAAGVIDAFDGIEGHLGELAGRDHSAAGIRKQTQLLNAVNSGQLNSSQADALVSGMFTQADGDALGPWGDANYREAMSGALARIMTPPGPPPVSGPAQQALQQKLLDAFHHDGARDMLTNPDVLPELRGWALAQLATNPEWTPEAVKDGWQSDVVAQTYAQPIVDRYAGRGGPQVVSGEALRNTIGQALGIAPDQLPNDNETAEDEAKRLAAGLDHRYYGDNEQLDKIATSIQRVGGEGAEVSVLPVVVTNNDFGAAVYNIFKVTDSKGRDRYVDDQGLTYDSLDDWSKANGGNRLPPGRMTYDADMDLSTVDLTTKASPSNTDTFGEWARKIGDGVALGAGVVAGVAIVVGSGGTAAPIVAGAAGAYITARAGEELVEDHRRGIDITDLSNPEVRGNWLDVAAGTLSLGALGAGARAARVLNSGAQISGRAATGVAALQIAANSADLAAASNQAVALAQNWDQLDNGQRTAGLLSLAFWGGMTAASTRSTGADLDDAFSFHRLRDHLDSGQVGDFIVRQDSFPYSAEGSRPDRVKSHIDVEGNLRPANPEGDTTVFQHVRGSEPTKSDSPFTSFSAETGTAKVYGDYTITADVDRLRADIESGKLEGVEIIGHDQVLTMHDERISDLEARFDANPTAKNRQRLQAAQQDRQNSARDLEVLVRGVIPGEYFTVARSVS